MRSVDSRSAFLENYLRRNGGNVILCLVFVSYQKCFSTLSAAFLYGPAFGCFSACLAVRYFAVYSVLGSSIKQTSTTMATSAMAV